MNIEEDSNLQQCGLHENQSQVHPHQYQQKEETNLKIRTIGVHQFNILP